MSEAQSSKAAFCPESQNSSSMDQRKLLLASTVLTQPPASRSPAANGGQNRNNKYANNVKNASGSANASRFGSGYQSAGRRGQGGGAGRRNTNANNGAVVCDTGPNAQKKVTSVGANAARPLNAKKQLRYDRYEYQEHETAAIDVNARGSTKYMRYPRTRKQSYNTPIFTKEQYLQSNCQFVVNAAGDYNSNLVDPDVPVEWEQIEELRMATLEPVSCPICLYPPIAAKITRCGHVYCWPCMLHYLSLSDKAWRKCPICYESVYAHQLKSFQSVPLSAVSVGSELSLTLMCRQRGSIIIAPAAQQSEMVAAHAKYAPDLPDAPNLGFSKLLLASAQDIAAGVLAREREQLQLKMWEDEGQPEACFITAAMKELDKRENELQMSAVVAAKQHVDSAPSSPEPDTVSVKSDAAICYVDAFDETVAQNEQDAAQAEGDDVSPEEEEYESGALSAAARVNRHSDARSSSGGSANSGSQAAPNKHVYYFYQGSDGQHVYLHPVNARCIIDEYGSLEQAPLALSGTVLQLEHLVMSAQIRHKFRYLTHLPVGTCFTLAEIQFAPGIISAAVQHSHAAEFARREAARVRREQSETRRQVRAEQLDRQLLMDPANYPKYYARKEELQPEDFPEIRYVGSAQRELQADWGAGEQQDTGAQLRGAWAAAATSPADEPATADLPSVPSFAQMLRQGKPKQSNAPAQAQGALAAATPVASSVAAEEAELAAPSLASAWGDAVDIALSSALQAKGEAADAAAEGGNKARKGKKKKKQIVLFST